MASDSVSLTLIKALGYALIDVHPINFRFSHVEKDTFSPTTVYIASNLVRETDGEVDTEDQIDALETHDGGRSFTLRSLWLVFFKDLVPRKDHKLIDDYFRLISPPEAMVVVRLFHCVLTEHIISTLTNWRVIISNVESEILKRTHVATTVMALMCSQTFVDIGKYFATHLTEIRDRYVEYLVKNPVVLSSRNTALLPDYEMSKSPVFRKFVCEHHGLTDTIENIDATHPPD